MSRPTTVEADNVTGYRRIGIFALAATILLARQPCLAASDGSYDAASARFYLQGCREFLKAQQLPWSAWMCVGKVLTLEAYSQLLSPPLRACIFKSAPPARLVGAIVNYVEANPSRWQESFSTLALEALAQTWPCPAQSIQ